MSNPTADQTERLLGVELEDVKKERDALRQQLDAVLKDVERFKKVLSDQNHTKLYAEAKKYVDSDKVSDDDLKQMTPEELENIVRTGRIIKTPYAGVGASDVEDTNSRLTVGDRFRFGGKK